MATLIERIKLIWHDKKLLRIVLLGVFVWLFVFFLLPQSQLFEYQYSVGEAWKYEDIIAPYDIEVMKSPAEIAEEKSLIREKLAILLNEDVFAIERSQAYVGRAIDQVYRDSSRVNEIDTLNALLSRIVGSFLNTIYVIDDSLDYVDSYIIRDENANQIVLSRDLIMTESEAKKALLKEISGRSDVEKSTYAIVPKIKLTNTLLTDDYRFMLDSAQSTIASAKYVITKGEKVVSRGEYISGNAFDRLEAYTQSRSLNPLEGASLFRIRVGYFLLALSLFGLMGGYLIVYYPAVVNSFKQMLFLAIWVILFGYLTYVIDRFQVLNVFFIPFVIVVLVFRVLFRSHLALVFHWFLVILCALIGDLGLDFILIQLTLGWVAFLCPPLTHSWNQFFKSILIVLATSLLVFVSFQLIRGQYDQGVDWQYFMWFAVQALLLLMAAPMIPLAERLFGFVSEVKLQELSNINQPLLKRLSREAAGTFQHSLNVSILAENAVQAIEGQDLLVKVAALYHDIGKLKSPAYFIENQVYPSPHDEQNEKKSAQIIIGHVAEGVSMAKQNGLPEIIVDFIASHHGDDRVEYFYRQYVKRTQGLFDDEKEFRYPGPRPRTKEQGVLLMADSLEAACKSIKEPTAEKIEALVNDIISGKLEKKLLSECELSFADLEKCRTSFVRTLMSMNHVRITYPDQKVT